MCDCPKLTFSPNGKTLASGPSGQNATLAVGAEVVGFSPDGKTVASGDPGEEAKQSTGSETPVWNVASGKSINSTATPMRIAGIT